MSLLFETLFYMPEPEGLESGIGEKLDINYYLPGGLNLRFDVIQ